ncbi:MAG: hypothetical protein AAF844_09370 [Pseudomonadota bacterium]
MVLKLGLGRDLADIAPETLPRRQRYLKALEAFEAQGSLLGLRQALLDQGELERRREDIDSAFDRVLGPPPPEDFTNFKAVVRWFRAHDPEVAVVFAARAALRVAPLLGSDKREEAPSALILPSLRATAAPWLAGARPSLSADLSAAAADAAAYAAYAADAAAAAAADAAAFAAAYAAAYAAYAAADAAADAAAYAARAAAHAAAADAADTAAAIREGCGAAALARRPLWQDGGMPPIFADAWDALKTSLLAREGEHWEVWTEWYEARLRGDPVNSILEYERVTSPEIDWNAGPATVNAKIKQIIARRRWTIEWEPVDIPPDAARPTEFSRRIVSLLDTAALRLSIAEWTLDHAHSFMVLVPFTGDVREDLDPSLQAALDEDLRNLHRELEELAEDIEDEPANAHSNRSMRSLIVKDLRRAMRAANQGEGPISPGALVRYGRNLNQHRLDPVVAVDLPQKLFERLGNLIDTQNRVIRHYLTGALARFEPLNVGPVPPDIPAEDVAAWVISAIDLVVDDTWDSTHQPGPAEKTTLRDIRSSLDDLRTELLEEMSQERDRSAEGRHARSLEDGIRRNGALGAATVLRFALKASVATKAGVAVAADAATLWPEEFRAVFSRLWELVKGAG